MNQTLFQHKKNHVHSICSILPYIRKGRVLPCFAVIILVLIVCLFLSLSGSRTRNFVLYHQNTEILPFSDGLHIAVNEKMLDKIIPAEKCVKVSSSLDGTISAFLTDTKELYLVNDKELIKIADDVLHFEIGATGQGVAFAQKYAKQNALTLYSLREGTRKEITTSLARLDFSLSPDGKAVAFYTQIDDQEVLMCYRNGQTVEISADHPDLVGLSNDGKYIYAACPTASETSVMYAFDHRGKASELGQVTSISFKFNHDHRQVMFYNNGKTLISTNGRPAVVVSDYPLYLVTSPNSQGASDGNAITLPVFSLYNHVYTCSDGETTSAWVIRKNTQKSEKLVSRVSGCILDASAEYLYFIVDHSQLCVMHIKNGISAIKVLAENADTYAVTSDRKRVYYADNGILYSVNGKKGSPPQTLSTDFTGYNLALSASDTLYYLSGSDLFACRNGRKTDRIAQNINNIHSSSNNRVYIIGEEEIYIAGRKKNPIKVLGNE